MNNYFSLPEINDFETKTLTITYRNEKSLSDNVFINKSLNYYLKNIKKEIDGKKDWDKFKKLTYSYEFISTKVCHGEKQFVVMSLLVEHSSSYMKYYIIRTL